ncbi:hypothetical protein MMC30_003848 [Trapelia coarctata]|nr:hypothetical protein [Trapelia coarctata]
MLQPAYYPKSMHTIDASAGPGQKRKRSPEIDSTLNSTPPYEPPWKRAGFLSADEANVAFWDNLSKVPLCPRALKEFDRRNRRLPRPTVLVDSWRDFIALKGYSVQLKNFARRGGPGLDGLRWYSKPAEGTSSSDISDIMPARKPSKRNPSNSSKSTSQSTRRTSAYNPSFEQNLVDHAVYPFGYRHPDGHRAPKPDNWQEIQQRMAQPRPSLSPSQFSDGAFDKFVEKSTDALNETEVMTNAFPIMAGESDIPSAIKRTFGNMASLTDGTIVDAEPDFYYGARPEQLNPRVREELNSYIIPSTNQSVPMLPNYFAEGKGPTGTRAVADRQALHDGGIGARAMHSLQSYGEVESVYDNNAYAITSTFDGRNLRMYTNHPTQPTKAGDRPGYYMNALNGWDITGNPDTFRQGATWFRNGRDWARDKRDEFIEAANGRVATLPPSASSGNSQSSTLTNIATVLESDTSEDELASDKTMNTHRAGKRPKREVPGNKISGERSSRRGRR